MKRRLAAIGVVVLVLGLSHVSFISAHFGSREECLYRCQIRTDACFDFCSGILVDRCEAFCATRPNPEECLTACDAVETACNRTCEIKLQVCTQLCERFFPESPSGFGD